MKKLMALAIGILLASVASSRALVGMDKVSYDGSLEVRGISADNEVEQNDDSQLSDHRGETNTRVRLGIGAALTEGVTGRIEFGRTGSTYGRSDSGSNTSSSIDNETARIRINNAYVDFANLLGLNVRLGRQYVGYVNDLVWNISPRQDDSLTIDAIDGILLGKKWDMVEASLFLGKAIKEDPQGSTNENLALGDVNLNSLDLMIPKLLPGGKITLGYLWGTRTSNSPRTTLQTYRAGVNGGVMENMITYTAEYLMNDGQNRIPAGSPVVKYEGSAIDLGVGVNIPENKAGKFAVGLGYLVASGDDNIADNKDESFHDFSTLGVASSDRYYGQIFSKSNVLNFGPGVDTGIEGQGMKVLSIGVEYLPAMVKNTSVRIDFFDLKTSEDGNASALPTADSFGQEWDFTVGYKASDNVGINGGYAMLKPDKAIVGIVPGTPDDTITELFANATIKWGAAE